MRAQPSPVAGTSDDGLFASLTRLAQLELELGLAETRQILVSAAIAVAIAAIAGIALVASLVVLVAGALAPLFGAAWEPLVIAGGGFLLLSAAAIAWSIVRLRALDWPRLTVASLEENWRWLGAQIRSRLTLR
jgi:hypothetical protein